MQSNFHLTTRHHEVNEPAGEELERFCLELGSQLRMEKNPTISALFLAGAFRRHFAIGYPFIKVHALLFDRLGVRIEHVDSDPKIPTVIYDYGQKQWVISLVQGSESMESIHLLHEFYELFWWRCYHLIPEWRHWANQANMKHPHDTADEFAHAVALPSEVFLEMAQKYGYNPRRLGGIFQVAPGACFHYLLRQRIPFPYTQLRLDFTKSPTQLLLEYEADVRLAQVVAKGCKFRKNLKSTTYPEMRQLNQQLTKKNHFNFAEQWIYDALESQKAMGRATQQVLGIHLPAPVFVVVRPQREMVFVQIVPQKHKDKLGKDFKLLAPFPFTPSPMYSYEALKG